jgi:DNA polymerase (family 10)
MSYESFPSALLYFTGSAELNKKMRQVAKEMGYKLSEYGLFKNNEKLEI